MNYLAHLFLARQSGAAMLGGIMGDFVKADVTGRYPTEIAREIQLHRYIDSYTDSHPAVKASAQLFPEGRRRYAGILLDVFYDHLLSLQWQRWCDEPRQAMLDRFYVALAEHDTLLPDRLRSMAPHMVQMNWLNAYDDFASVDKAVQRISLRLSRNGAQLRDGIADLRQHYEAIAAGFEGFFPELLGFVQERRGRMVEQALRQQ
ncbi:MAG: ACP phosphodiesterase [Burkholderiaceae bacterium]|nr:ACP phosphodiesterase [Burkholderiaceae bacterium]